MIEGAMNEDANVPAFAQQYGADFPVGKVDYKLAGAYFQLSPMVRSFVPFMMFIDRKGMIQAQYTGGDDFLKDEDTQPQKIRDEVLKLLASKPVLRKTK